MDKRIDIEKCFLKYLEWCNDIDTELGYTISIAPIREYLDTVLYASWEGIERFISEMINCSIPYKNQVEIMIKLAETIKLAD